MASGGQYMDPIHDDVAVQTTSWPSPLPRLTFISRVFVLTAHWGAFNRQGFQ